MRIIALKCDRCGAPLDVPVDREQLTCTWCGSMLHVSHLHSSPDSAIGTSEAEADASPPAAIQQELAQLDAEWEAYRAQYLSRDGSGEYIIPEAESCRMGAWVTGIIGAVLALFAALGGQWVLLILFLVAALVTIFVLVRQARIAPVYQRSIENYRQARQAILDRLPSAS